MLFFLLSLLWWKQTNRCQMDDNDKNEEYEDVDDKNSVNNPNTKTN